MRGGPALTGLPVAIVDGLRSHLLVIAALTSVAINVARSTAGEVCRRTSGRAACQCVASLAELLEVAAQLPSGVTKVATRIAAAAPFRSRHSGGGALLTADVPGQRSALAYPPSTVNEARLLST